MVDRDTMLATRRYREDGVLYVALDDVIVNLEALAMVSDAEGHHGAARHIRQTADWLADFCGE